MGINPLLFTFQFSFSLIIFHNSDTFSRRCRFSGVSPDSGCHIFR
jgi:hypothetical protein